MSEVSWKHLESLFRLGVCATAALALLWPGTVRAGSGLKAKGSLSATGAAPGASAKFTAAMKAKKSKFQVKAKGLAPATEYDLVIDGEPQERTRSNGRGSLKFKVESTRDAGMGFDPYGKAIGIQSAAAVSAFEGVFASAGESSDTKYDERADLYGTALAPDAEGEVRYQIKKGQASFECEVEDLPDGQYDIVVGGVPEIPITVSGRKGEVEIEEGLTFDARGKTIDIAIGLDVYLTGVARAPSAGIDSCNETEDREELGPAVGYPSSSGHMKYEIDDDCDPGFDIEIEDLPSGLYPVTINGTPKGSIEVVVTSEGNEGELEFGDDDGGPPLDFDPFGAQVEIFEGAMPIWTATFSGGNATPPSGACDSFEITRSLIVTGVDPDVEGEAKWSVDDDCDGEFEVEIEDGSLGTHSLWIDGTNRGTFEVVLEDGEPEGEIEFDTSPETGELLLDFDPPGRLIEVQNAGGQVIAHYTWPSS